jgi:hypothetical protein
MICKGRDVHDADSCQNGLYVLLEFAALVRGNLLWYSVSCNDFLHDELCNGDSGFMFGMARASRLNPAGPSLPMVMITSPFSRSVFEKPPMRSVDQARIVPSHMKSTI